MRRNSRLKTQNSTLTAIVPLLMRWFTRNARELPWRRARDPYAIWVSEIMLQQTQVKTVIPYWERWMRELPTIRSVANASPAKLHKLWEGLGYYTRVRNLQRAAQIIVEQHDGEFPKSFDDILALSGIGHYTAGAICSIAFNQPKPILDGNVIRVLTRIFGIAADPREKKINARLWQLAEELVLHASRITHHTSSCAHFNQSLMELGALVCTPRAPRCHVCPVNKLCVAQRRDLQEQLPNLGRRQAATARRFMAFIIDRAGRFLVHQRPAGVVNAHLWEFPNVEIPVVGADLKAAAHRLLGRTPVALKLLCVVRHSITRYRITLEAHRVRLRSPPARRAGVWLTPAQLKPLAFASAHKKILGRLARSDH